MGIEWRIVMLSPPRGSPAPAAVRLSDALSLPGRCHWRAVVCGNALRQARLVATQLAFAPLQGIGGLGGCEVAGCKRDEIICQAFRGGGGRGRPPHCLRDGGATDCYFSPPETLLPQRTLDPHRTLLPHSTLLPQRTLLPAGAFEPQRTLLPHGSCDPQRTLLP